MKTGEGTSFELVDGPSLEQVRQENLRTAAAEAKDRMTDALTENEMRLHRPTPRGRSFLWNTFRYKEDYNLTNYRKNFDNIFPDAPGAGV